MIVDTDDLIDSTAVAALLGLSSYRAVSTYRRRHADFPAPVIVSDSGRCSFWLRSDVVRWRERRGETRS